MNFDELRDYQKECIEKLREGLRGGHRSQILVAPTGAGKCLGKDTPVLMFDGRIKLVQDVVVGDLLIGPDSNPRKVLSVAKGVGPLYRVKPNRGDSYVVNDAHILSLIMTGGATKWNCEKSDTYKQGKIHNISVVDYLSKSKTFKHCAKGWRAAVNFPKRKEENFLIHPYFLGIWLGDGLSRGPAICTADKEVMDFVRSFAQFHGLKINVQEQKNNASIVVHITSGKKSGRPFNSVRSALSLLGLINNKHIPHEYLTASRGNRLELLAGLLDTDGSLSRGGFDFIQKNESIARDVAFLARSLGLAAYVSACKKTCGNNGKVGDYFRVSISGDCSIIPNRIPSKKAPKRLAKKNPLLVGISIDPIGRGEYFGFEIDGDRLFLLGDFTVTHNTVIASFLLGEAYNKQSRAFFVCDRVSLVDQTSATLDSYGVAHGVIQADHWRARPWEPIQVVSAQTLARRELPYTPKLLVWDEAHTMYKSVLDYCSDESIKVVGLTATPFAKGMGKVFTNVVNSTTTNSLIDQGWLVPVKMFAAKEIDMKGAELKFDGEWKESEIEDRGIKIVGDVVEEWISKTQEFFGKPEKTIVFSATVTHGEELCREFAKRGYNFQQISYKDGNGDSRRRLIEEFRKSDSSIVGLVSCEALAKGFDVTDIKIGIGARPYRKSLSGHIQQMGRVMRSHPGKEFSIWLDHSGNVIRFLDDTQEVFENGVSDLSTKEYDAKARKEKTEKEKTDMKCPACGFITRLKICPSCGHEKKGARSLINNSSGAMVEVNGKKSKLKAHEWQADKNLVWGELCYLAYEVKRNDQQAEKFALAQYRNIFGQWPSQKYSSSLFVPPRKEVRNKVRSNLIAYRAAMTKRRAA